MYKYFFQYLRKRIQIRSGDFLGNPGSEKGKNPDPGSGMNIPDHFSESLKEVFSIKILKFFYSDADLVSRDLFDPGSGRPSFEEKSKDFLDLMIILEPTQSSRSEMENQICSFQQCCGTVTILYGSGSGFGSDFRKVMVPVPVPTFKKVMVPVPVPTLEKLRFRFRFQLHI